MPNETKQIAAVDAAAVKNVLAAMDGHTTSTTPAPAVKLVGIDSLFTIEHQGMIAGKYRAKYSDTDQNEHKTAWPQFAGNHFMMYVLAETLAEAQNKVFSVNKPLLLNSLRNAMENYTPTVPGATLTEIQISFNKVTDLQLQALYEKVPVESQRVDLLTDFAKKLKQASKTGKDTDQNRAKFSHAAATLGIVAGTIW